jgi:nucleotide-binding universal stress UspA family protein
VTVFRRSPAAGPPVRMGLGKKDAAHEGIDLPSRTDEGTVLVAVDGSGQSWDALEWAAAEAAARRCTLRIVHVVHVVNSSPPVLGGYMGVFVGEWDSGVLAAAKRLLDEAERRASAVAPGLAITTRLHEGSTAAGIVLEGRRDALIVVGRGHNGGRISTLARSASMQVARRASAPVVVVELSGRPTNGPSARRVVVSVDCTTEPLAAFGFAFRAALRRRIGLTVLRASGISRPLDGMSDSLTAEWTNQHRALQTCRQAFPDVSVRQRVIEGPAVSALIAESEGAALVVIGSEERGRLQGLFSESVGNSISRLAHSPVAIVGGR